MLVQCRIVGESPPALGICRFLRECGGARRLLGIVLGHLDRIGVHLYPIFLPRMQWQPVLWIALLAVYCESLCCGDRCSGR